MNPMLNFNKAAVAVSLLTLACAAHLRADAAEDYCTASTGKVVFRQATYNTNGGTPLPLAQTKPFCE
jgi:hypothetical protein